MKKISLILIVLAMLFAAVACGEESTSTLEVQSLEEKQEAEVVPTEILVAPTEIPATSTEVPTPVTRDPRISDFELELIILEEKCFGSAGCLITVRPNLTVLTTTLAGEWLLIYEIHGVDNGSQTYNLELHLDTGQYSLDDELLSTPGGSDTLTVEIVKIIPN